MESSFCSIGVFFHIAIGIAFPLPAFGLIMVGFLLGCMPTDIYAAIYKKVTGSQFAFHHPTDELESKDHEQTGKSGSRKNGIIIPGLQKKVIAAYLCFWLISLVIIHFRSPFYLTYAGDKNSLWGTAYNIGAYYKARVYPFTGFSTHGLYVDSHFQNYTYQIKLIYSHDDKNSIVPVIRSNGMAGIYDVGRNHIYWTFRTAWPHVSKEVMEKRMKRFVLFWMGKNDIDMDGSVFKIFTRPLKVSLTDFSEGLWHENISREWKLSGKFIVHNDEFEYKWLREFREGLISQ